MSQTTTDTAVDTPPGMQPADTTPSPSDWTRESGQSVLSRALARPRYEIIPMRGALNQARKIPVGATVTVTCSPSRGMPATIELAEQIHQLGYTVVPHLAARRFTSRGHLNQTVDRLAHAGIQDVFVVGGDGTDQAGPFSRGADLMTALAERWPGLRSVGIPCYPEGHSSIESSVLDAALDAKCFFAGYMVTQICFDADVIGDWLTRIRGRGVDLPVYVGIPGVIERRKLLSIALKIGLGDSTRFLRKNGSFMSRLTGPSRFTPEALIDDLASRPEVTGAGMAGLHINTFNQVESTETWRREQLERLTETTDPAIPVASSDDAYYSHAQTTCPTQ